MIFSFTGPVGSVHRKNQTVSELIERNFFVVEMGSMNNFT